MLIALTKTNELIDAAVVNKAENQSYYCPGCKAEVFLKQGVKKAAHFCHYQAADCHGFSEGETPEHIAGKRWLENYFKSIARKVELEAYLSDLQQRPDLLVTFKNFKIAVEFQCSPISVEKLIERTEGYLKAQYRVLWIVGSPLQLKTQLKAIHKAMLTDTFTDEACLFQLDLNKQKLICHYDFYYDSHQSQQIETDEFNSIRLRPRAHHLSPTKEYKIVKDSLHKLERMRYHRTPGCRDFFQKLYEAQCPLEELPINIFKPCAYEWSIDMPPYEWKTALYLWVLNQPKHTLITQKSLVSWLKSQQSIKLIHNPCIKAKYVLTALEQFMNYLVKLNLLKQTQLGHYLVIKS